jgi:hypothetical protein
VAGVEADCVHLRNGHIIRKWQLQEIRYHVADMVEAYSVPRENWDQWERRTKKRKNANMIDDLVSSAYKNSYNSSRISAFDMLRDATWATSTTDSIVDPTGRGGPNKPLYHSARVALNVDVIHWLYVHFTKRFSAADPTVKFIPHDTAAETVGNNAKWTKHVSYKSDLIWLSMKLIHTL